ncbi:hypothetical protein DSCA_06590 [Desulfosarcina alkanivorans]|uniref:Uncharacterized protein n=1 Tax=Desulfosarcina alkanivorans TaxID=571177 RepID=A0A5K7YG34_9BACT|nr:hypothetical protein DSCA_06590 [Desulfosarcina alkanivorans]
MEETAGTSEGLRVLFNPELTVLLDEIANSSLCVGPIGSGFWWPSIFNKPCVTLHPRGDYSNIHAYNWIASPPKGVKPGFLYLLDHEKFICIEEERSIPRNVYDDLNVDVERVLESSLNLLK